MTPSHDENRQISALTLDYYQRNAAGFQAGTRDHDVSQNIAALLRHIKGAPPYRILDFGCGPGRDLKAFSSLGHDAIGLDGTEAFVSMARVERSEEHTYELQSLMHISYADLCLKKNKTNNNI